MPDNAVEGQCDIADQLRLSRNDYIVYGKYDLIHARLDAPQDAFD